MNDTSMNLAQPGQPGKTEKAFEKLLRRDKRLMKLYLFLLVFPLGTAGFYIKYGRTDTEKVQDIVSATVGPLKQTIAQTEPALQQIQSASAQLTDQQEKLAVVGVDLTRFTADLEAKASVNDLNKVNGNIAEVRTDLEATKNNLQMTRGEFDTLIARNHEDIETFRRLGERSYFEFTIVDKNKPQEVGDVAILLLAVDESKYLFTLDIIVKEKRLVMENRSVDEAIYFYVGEERRPHELVIKEASRGKISGYLAVPRTLPSLSASKTH
jgi:hypothetical protein